MPVPLADVFVRVRLDSGEFSHELKSAVNRAVGNGIKVPVNTEARQRIAEAKRVEREQSASTKRMEREVAASLRWVGREQARAEREELAGIKRAEREAIASDKAKAREAVAAARLAARETEQVARRSGRGLNDILRRSTAGTGRGVGQRFGHDFRGGLLSSLGGIGGVVKVAAAAGIAKGISSIVSGGANLEQGLANIQAVSGATGAQMDLVSKKALQLGADVRLGGLSATDAAGGIEQLVKAGVSLPDILSGAAVGAITLAKAGGIEIPAAAELGANALKTFNLRGSDMAHVADQIAGAANASTIDVSEFGLSLSQAGVAANLVGLDFNDTATAIALMGNAGIKGSDAGTSLKTMFINLQPQTKKQIALAEKLGIVTKNGANAFFDAHGKAKSLSQIAGVLQTSLKGMTEQQKISTLQQLFGTDALRASAILAKAGSAGVNQLGTSIGKTSAIQVAAAKQSHTFKGALDVFKGTVESLSTSIGLKLLPHLTRLVRYGSGTAIPWIERTGKKINATLKPAFDSLKTSVKNVMREFTFYGGFKTLFAPLTGTGGHVDIGKKIRDIAAQFAAWSGSTRGQSQIKKFLDDVRSSIDGVRTTLTTVAGFFKDHPDLLKFASATAGGGVITHKLAPGLISGVAGGLAKAVGGGIAGLFKKSLVAAKVSVSGAQVTVLGGGAAGALGTTTSGVAGGVATAEGAVASGGRFAGVKAGLSKGAKVAGGALIADMAGQAIVSMIPGQSVLKSTLSASLHGGAIGAAVGSVIPGVGTAIGAAAGAVIGGSLGFAQAYIAAHPTHTADQSFQITKTVGSAIRARDPSKLLTDTEVIATATAQGLKLTDDEILAIMQSYTRFQHSTGDVIKSQRLLDASFTINGKTLAANRPAINAAISAAEKHRNSMLQEGASADEANLAYNTEIASIETIAGKYGISKAELDKYLASVKIVPKRSTTEITADITKAQTTVGLIKTQLADPTLTKERRAKLSADLTLWEGKLKTYNTERDAAASPITTKITLSIGDAIENSHRVIAEYGKIPPTITTRAKLSIGDAVKNSKDLGLKITLSTGASIPSKAAGGLIHGAGGPTDDRVPIWASNKEYMIRAASVSKYGTGMLDQINTGKYAKGGVIGKNPGMSFPLDVHLSGLENIGGYGGALAWARQQIGKPYVWGAAGPNGYDCIAAGTPITTRRGDVAIEDVTTDDMVLTRRGYRRVLRAWLVRKNAETVGLEVNGRLLRGTADHRVWTEQRGWVPLDAVTSYDTLVSCQEANELYSTGMRTSGILTQIDQSTVPISAGHTITFTEPSGDSTTDRFPQDARSTISTTTHSTTTSPISYVYQPVSTDVRARLHDDCTPMFVHSVGSSFKRSQQHETIRLEDSVVVSTIRSTTTIRELPRSDVYDLTVDGEHEFFAAGVLVHNCSGFMSAIINKIHGKSIGSRLFSTSTMPGGGLVEGASSPFQVGWFVGNPGHTAGTLNGVNVESTGDHVRVGGDAHGASSGQFNRHAGLVLGAATRATGGTGDQSPAGAAAAKVAAAVAAAGGTKLKKAGIIDQGGWLMPGEFVTNHTRHPERVLSPAESAAHGGITVDVLTQALSQLEFRVDRDGIARFVVKRIERDNTLGERR
jgi:TP901 family phage tail tape measure protein